MDSKLPKLTNEVLSATIAADIAVKPEDVVVENIKIIGGLPKGTNYTSTLIKFCMVAKVKENVVERNYAAKFVPLTNPKREAMINKVAFYENECAMYLNVLPNLTALDDKINVPKVFHADCKNRLIIMEDLTVSGWLPIKINICFDLDQPKAALQWLARFHAASYHYLDKMEGGINCFTQQNKVVVDNNWIQGPSHKDQKVHRAVFAALKAVLADCSEKVDSKVLKKIEYLSLTNYKEITRVQEALGHFNCITHGDMWANNLMFKKDELNDTQVCAFDFQLSYYARPTVDVAKLLYTTMNPDLRAEFEYELLDYYYTFLIARLKSLGYSEDIYLKVDFDRDYNECRVHGLAVSIVFKLLKLALGGEKDALLNFVGLGYIESEEKLQEYIARFVQAQVEMSRRKPPLREELIALANEAVEKGMF